MTETIHSPPMDEKKTASRLQEDENLSKVRDNDWPSVLYFIHIHLLATYGAWLLFTDCSWLTAGLFVLLCFLGTIGVTCGSHRLWAHRTYKANTVLRTFLMICHTLSGQGPIYDWVQYHRLHHAHFGTDADPYNHNKGLLFSHITTNFKSLSQYQQKLMSKIDVSDLEADNIVMFQKKFYWLMYSIVFLLLPINAPLEYWNDSILNSIFIMGFLRAAVVLHSTWLVHSAMHVWGLKPGEKYPADTNMVFILTKSYWPHYHYLIPTDYKSGEFGSYGIGCSTTLIKVWAAMGAATNLKTIDSNSVKAALAECVSSDKPIEQCLKEAQEKQESKEDDFLLDE